VVLEMGLMEEEKLNRLLCPYELTKPGNFEVRS
jgi:hypothetical protein